MTNDEHRLRYKKDLDVHHKTPYRLTFDNSPDNLIPVCVACHAKLEGEIRRNLTPQEKAIMIANTERAIADGLFVRYDPRVPCPNCGNPKRRKSELCMDCRIQQKGKERAARLERLSSRLCAKCGKSRVSGNSTICRGCYMCRGRNTDFGHCETCGVALKTPTAIRCRNCQNKLNARKHLPHNKR